MRHVARYHPLLVILHWGIAALIFAALTIGFFGLANIDNAAPQKIAILGLHMAGGMLILALMAVRFVVSLVTAHPPRATIGTRVFDCLAPVAHGAFYLLILLMAATGLATAIVAGLNRIVFQSSGEPLPPSFADYPTFVAHRYMAAALAGLIALHALSALYHQVVRHDRLIGRMGFGRRDAAKPAE